MLPRVRRSLIGPLLALLLAAPVAGAESEPFTLNLKEAELQSLIETVAQRTGRQFIVDPRVDARVTVISAVPVEDDELYEVFRAVLAVHGYEAVDLGEMAMIIPASTAPQRPIPVTDDDDEPVSSAMVTRVLTVENVAAEQLVPVLQPLLGGDGQLAAYGPTNRLIVTDNAQNVRRLRRIINRVDQPIERDIETVRLEHASAEEMVRVLGEMATEEQAAEARVAADPRTNRVLIRGGEQTRIELRALIADLDQPTDLEDDTRVIHLRHANAEDLVEIIAEAGRAQTELGAEEGAEGERAEPVVQADGSSNALVLSGRPEILASLESLIRQLDIRRAQVHVEALIAELSMDQARELGIQFAAADDETLAGLTRFAGEGSDIVSIATSPETIGSGLSIGALTDRNGTDFGALLRAVAADAENNILSTPSLVTMDNQEAEILVGENVPFITGQFTGQEVGDVGGQSPFQTIEREDIGIRLGITPQINEGDTVQLEIEQEVSDIAGTAQAADLITNTREIRTTVLVEDGQTLVLGGLVDESVRTSREQVPLLGSIPVLGQLFRYDSTESVKQNLMVFLNPSILRDARDGTALTREPYDAMREQQQEWGEDRRRGLGTGELPTLPELELEVGEPEGS